VPAPSGLMSAEAVAKACYDKYQATAPLPAALRTDIDQLAGYFLNEGLFKSLFINRLVPWSELTGRPNAGHAAVADLLLSGAARATLSANFDTMIEQWARERKVPLRGAMTGQEAVDYASQTNPLVKFHGCMWRCPEDTLWTQGQLTLPDVQSRVESCKQWMALNLPNRDLLVIGFWTDWGYLNEVLADAFATGAPNSVTVVDLNAIADLQVKAPTFWTLLTATTRFEHVQISGNDVLAEIRLAYLKVWLRKMFAFGRALYQAEKGTPPPAALSDPPVLPVEQLYDLRRDAEGLPSSRAARQFEPDASAGQTGFFHLLLSEAADGRKDSWYTKGGTSIRVVHGAGEALSSVEGRFVEPPATEKPDVVVCVGAIELGLPSRIIAKGAGASIVRPKSGSGSRWVTFETARAEFGI
jgi:hypothetical protein